MLKTLIQNLLNEELKYLIPEGKRKAINAPKIMYHGTTSKFLPKIFQLGMIPNPTKGKWKNSGNPEMLGSASRRSLESLPGSYWTSNIMIASGAANNSRRKFGGDNIIIIAQLVAKSAKADEDNIANFVSYAFKEAISPWFGARDEADSAWAMEGMIEGDPKIKKEMLSIFEKSLHNKLKSNSMPLDKSLLDFVFDAYLKRILGHVDISSDNFYTYKWEYLENYKRYLVNVTGNDEKAKERIENKKERLPKYNKSETERQYSLALDKLSSRYKKTTLNTDGILGITFRMTEPIGFSGRNKIIAILSYNPTAKPSSGRMQNNIFTLEYGNNIPNKFINDWRRQERPDFSIVDKKDGKVLYKG